MVKYSVVRYTREIICTVEGEEMAKAIANVCTKNDYEDDNTCIWYGVEPDAVL